MGGGFSISNMPNNTEYNFFCDPEAVDIVLNNPVKKVLIPLDLTHQIIFNKKDIENFTIGKNNSNIFKLLKDIFIKNYEAGLKFGESGAVLHDTIAAAYFYFPENFETSEERVIVNQFGAIKNDPAGTPVKVVKKINPLFFKDYIRNIFKEL